MGLIKKIRNIFKKKFGNEDVQRLGKAIQSGIEDALQKVPDCESNYENSLPSVNCRHLFEPYIPLKMGIMQEELAANVIEIMTTGNEWKSNNWMKMHGFSMRRNIRKKRGDRNGIRRKDIGISK